MKTSKFFLVAFLLAFVACSESPDEQSTPEYWAEIMQQPTDENYLRYREFLDKKSPIERREFLDRVSQLRGTVENPPIEGPDYITYEHAFISMVESVNSLTGESRDLYLQSVDRMKDLLDSPFRFYDRKVVSMIPEIRMTDEQFRHLNLIQNAVNYQDVRDFIGEGAPLKLNIEDDKMVVVIGALSARGYGILIVSTYIELDLQTGEAERLIRY